MPRRRPSALIALCGAAPIVFGALTLFLAADALAQYGAVRRYPPGVKPEESDDEPTDEDPRAGMPGARQGGPQAPDNDPASRPKTDLGKRIVTLQFQRTPQAVLAARSALAARAREKLLKPDEEDKEPEAPVAEPAPDAMGEMPPGMPPEMMEMLARRAELGAAPAVPGPDDAAKLEAAADPAQAAAAAKAKAAATAKIGRQAEYFRLLVVAGDWTGMGQFLLSEGGADAGAIYSFVLKSLAAGDSALVPDEVIAISDAAPADLTDKQITRLGELLKATKNRGTEAAAVAARIKRGTLHFGGDDPVKRKRAASLLVAAGLSVEAVEYLPPLAQAREAQDAELLSLHAAYFRALSR